MEEKEIFKIKKLISLFTVMVLVFMTVLPMSAIEATDATTIDTIPISSASAEGRIVESIDLQHAITRGVSIVWVDVIRSGNTESCESILSWAGTDLYSLWKFTDCVVDDANYLYNTEYGTIHGRNFI